jgi:16S rRNA processing protein RimM
MSQIANANNNVYIGTITSVNGVRGNVKIRIFTSSPTDIENFKKVFDENGNTYSFKVLIEKKDYIIASIEGVNSRNEAENLLNTSLYVDRKDLPEAAEEEFYYADLIGLEVLDDADKLVGKVCSVVNYGAGDIIEITPPQSEKTFMVPFSKVSFPKVDLQKGVLVYSAPDEVSAA